MKLLFFLTGCGDVFMLCTAPPSVYLPNAGVSPFRKWLTGNIKGYKLSGKIKYGFCCGSPK